jgi:hypothetical protein
VETEESDKSVTPPPVPMEPSVESTGCKALFIASFKAGDKAVAREEFDFLRGREIDSGIAREINGLLRARD